MNRLALGVCSLVLSILVACGTTPAAALDDANAKLAASDWDGAAKAAQEGLAVDGGTPAERWQLELVGLEAQARGGHGAEATATLDRLATAYPAQVDAKLFVTTAHELREAGDKTGAIGLLDAAAKRFPSDSEVAQAIADIKASGSVDEKAQLETLGYIQ